MFEARRGDDPLCCLARSRIRRSEHHGRALARRLIMKPIAHGSRLFFAQRGERHVDVATFDGDRERTRLLSRQARDVARAFTVSNEPQNCRPAALSQSPSRFLTLLNATTVPRLLRRLLIRNATVTPEHDGRVKFALNE